GIAVIEAIVEAEFAFDVIAFVLAAGDADGTRALDPRNLADGRADRAGGGGNYHGLTGLRLADLEEPGVGSHAGHAEHADRRRNRRQCRIDFAQGFAVGERVRLPA